MKAKYDLIVIGAGSGGLVVATTAKRRGMRVAMLEKDKIGGECTHSGCVPSKALIQSTKQLAAISHTTQYGLPAIAPVKANFATVMEYVDSVVQGIYAHETPDVWQKQGIDVYVHEAGAKFLNANTVSIGPTVLEADHFVLCTGSSPRVIDLPGSENVNFLHNENFWDLRTQPKSIVFVGGGVISAELGQSMALLGTQVSIIDRNERILKVVDDEVAQVLIEEFRALGIQTIGRAELKGFRQEGEETITLIEVDGIAQELRSESVFLAVGRTPNLYGMDLGKAGVAFSERGIKVNEYLQTTASNIYACGDVATPAKFTHVAAYQAVVCVDNIEKGNHRPNDLSILPWAIFSDPEIAHVGLSEKQAIEQYGEENIQVFKVDATVDRFITDGKTKGFLKVIFGPNDKVLGADAIGAHAAEWTQMLTLVMKHDLPLDEFVYTIYSYPTYSEIVKKVITRYLRTKK
ncbi:MAG: NAD(P)/FAD-dependent oxidoreductase [Bacteroidia bacterium]